MKRTIVPFHQKKFKPDPDDESDSSESSDDEETATDSTGYESGSESGSESGVGEMSHKKPRKNLTRAPRKVLMKTPTLSPVLLVLGTSREVTALASSEDEMPQPPKYDPNANSDMGIGESD